MSKISTLAFSTMAARFLMTGCSSVTSSLGFSSDDEEVAKKGPNSEIVRIQETEMVSDEYVEHKIGEVRERVYNKNFIQKEIASNEDEVGIYSVNKAKTSEYKVERVVQDNLDMKMKSTDTKTIGNMKSSVNKNFQKIATAEQTRSNTHDRNRPRHVWDMYPDKDINGEINGKNRFNDRYLNEEYGLYIKAFEKDFPLIMTKDGDVVRNDLQTGKMYLISLNDKSQLSVFEVLSNQLFKEVRMYSEEVYKILNTYPMQISNKVVTAAELEYNTKVYFTYNQGIMTFFNQKFKKVLPIYKDFTIRNTRVGDISINIDLSVLDFRTDSEKMKDEVKEAWKDLDKLDQSKNKR